MAAFDSDPEKVGRPLGSKLRIQDSRELEKVAREKDIQIGVIATPGREAQSVADRLSKAGIHAILNFSKTQISVPEGCVVENIDFTIRLDILTYQLKETLGL